MQSVPKKFRSPANTDSELKTMETQRKRKEKKVLNANKKEAETINSAYLLDALKATEDNSEISENEESIDFCESSQMDFQGQSNYVQLQLNSV